MRPPAGAWETTAAEGAEAGAEDTTAGRFGTELGEEDTTAGRSGDVDTAAGAFGAAIVGAAEGTADLDFALDL